MKLKDIAGDHVIAVPVLAEATAGSDDNFQAVMVPFNCTIQSVTWVPSVAVTANGTNYAVLELRNGGATGAGTTALATRSYIATNSVALTAEAVTLTATTANLSLTAGDLIYVNRTHTASGVATPAGTFNVVVRARS